jgi:hypothetical protein
MKTLIVVVSALLLLAIAACHAYRAYAGLPLVMGTHAVPMMASYIAAGVTGLLGLLLLIFARK